MGLRRRRDDDSLRGQSADVDEVSTPSEEAFSACPNRSVTHSRQSGALVLKCAKYKEPTELRYTHLENTEIRRKVAETLGCLGCSYKNVDALEERRRDLIDSLHPAVAEAVGDLFHSEHYPQAVMEGFKVVRDRLRELTGHERATEAFGKGGLRIEAEVDEHVEADFQRGAQFLLMGLDMFRNVGAHSRFGSASGSEIAREFLAVSSLAMNLLDGGTVDGEDQLGS